MTPARAGTSAVAGVLGAAGLLLVLVTWAASIGPDEVLRSPGRPAGSSFIPSDSSTAQLGPTRTRRPPAPSHPHHVPAWLHILATLVEVLAAIAAVYLLARVVAHVWSRWDNRQRRPTRIGDVVDFDVLEDPDRLAEALEADAAVQRALLEEGEPRNAIVACWHRLEVTAERAGARRRTWQTPSEFVLAVLEIARADGDAVMRLAGLYREARFSDHPLTEEQRREAMAALDATHQSLARAAGRPGAAR